MSDLITLSIYAPHNLMSGVKVSTTPSFSSSTPPPMPKAAPPGPPTTPSSSLSPLAATTSSSSSSSAGAVSPEKSAEDSKPPPLRARRRRRRTLLADAFDKEELESLLQGIFEENSWARAANRTQTRSQIGLSSSTSSSLKHGGWLSGPIRQPQQWQQQRQRRLQKSFHPAGCVQMFP